MSCLPQQFLTHHLLISTLQCTVTKTVNILKPCSFSVVLHVSTWLPV